MKKYLKTVVPISLGIIGVIIIYQFMIVPGGETKKLESARRDTFFKCDKRFDAVIEQVRGLPQSILDDLMLDNELKCAYTKDYQFNIDSPLYCGFGTDGQYHASVHNRDSYINGCVIWIMDKLGY